MRRASIIDCESVLVTPGTMIASINVKHKMIKVLFRLFPRYSSHSPYVQLIPS
jgi:hypothetical protein